MANWKYTLEVKDAWKATQAGEMSIPAFAAHAAEKIKRLGGGRLVEGDPELFDIVEELEFIAADPDADVDEFYGVWNNLYNWADQVVGGWRDKMCWVRTF